MNETKANPARQLQRVDCLLWFVGPLGGYGAQPNAPQKGKTNKKSNQQNKAKAVKSNNSTRMNKEMKADEAGMDL